jgi:hypothetical protein
MFAHILYKRSVIMCIINLRVTDCCVVKVSEFLQSYVPTYCLIYFIL